MLQLTKRTEYGLIAMTHLASNEARGTRVTSAREISECYPVPKRLLAEVLKDLSREELVDSQRGAHGGYTLARPAHEITVGDVVAALEGPPSLTTCESLGAFQASGRGANGKAGTCDVEPVCPIRGPIHQLRLGIWNLLQRTTLSDLAKARATRAVTGDTNTVPRIDTSRAG